MTARTVLPIVELRAFHSRLGRSLFWSDSILTNVNPTTSEITHQTPVVWPDASHIQDSARGNRRKTSIQTP